MLRGLALTAFVIALGFGGWVGYLYWPRPLVLSPVHPSPIWEWHDDRQVVRLASEHLIARTDTFEDELTAYLHFESLRGRSRLRGVEVLLTAREVKSRPQYQMYFHLPNDILSAFPLLESLKRDGWIVRYEIEPATRIDLLRKQRQTRVFIAAYNFPVKRKLESMDPDLLLRTAQKFLLFKSRIDGRIRRQLEPVPDVLTPGSANQLAADIITVCEFYDLPLEVMLGIGAMENNFMEARGDLEHVVWKRRALSDDIVVQRGVLRRGRRGVLVANFSTGVWQITRETLRYVHKLYLKDERDYERLPERLRPPKDLNLDEADPHVLTTYAGLLLRHLLDYFEGDIHKAIGAYNGGKGNPNLLYGEGVQLVARYARSLFERVAALNGQTALETEFLAPGK